MHRGRIAAVSSLLALTLASCPSCSAPRSRDTRSAGAGGGSCRADLVLALGACVSPRVASAICGPTAVPIAGGCVPRAPCEAGRARDLATGECLARRDVRAIATSLGVLVAEDELLDCPSGAELAYASAEARGGPPRLACLGPQAASGVATRCGVGSIATPAGGCLRVALDGQLDAVAWLQAVVGAEGAAGAPPLCEALERRASFLSGVPARDARLFVALTFPNNDVTQVSADVRVIASSGGSDVAATAELAAAVGSLVEALRALASAAPVASVASVASTVHCSGALARVTPPAAHSENDVRR